MGENCRVRHHISLYFLFLLHKQAIIGPSLFFSEHTLFFSETAPLAQFSGYSRPKIAGLTCWSKVLPKDLVPLEDLGYGYGVFESLRAPRICLPPKLNTTYISGEIYIFGEKLKSFLRNFRSFWYEKLISFKFCPFCHFAYFLFVFDLLFIVSPPPDFSGNS